jgi:murein DD-endopeptidase MepM/ murein hydrolase activator NlpD
MAATPPWVDELLGSSATSYRPPEQRGGATGGDDVAGYIRSAAAKRGIDPDIAIKVAQSEGGLEPAKRGTFKTGSSWWPFQLHYGGKGYERFGDVAGMGNSFTAQTGYQPGDPAAWRAATDYALDAAAKNGWGAWYGARNVGITGRQGIGAAPTAAAPPAAVDASFRYGRDEGPGVEALPNAPAGAPTWVRELLSAQGGAPRATGAQRPPATAPAGAPAWAAELLASGNVGARGGSGAAEDYRGEAQTDEIWPVAGQRWGKVNNPFGGTQSRSAGATVALPSSNVGADLTAPYGAPVVAPVSGTVVEVFDAPDERDRNANHGWGGMTLLRGDNGYFYRLSHARPGSIATRPGQRVEQGQQLQQVGTSGNSTGAHLDAEKFAAPGRFVDIAAGRGGTVAASAGGSAAPTGGPVPAWVRELMG